MTQALGTFAVRGRIPDEVHDVLPLAEEYREKLCALYQTRHNRTIDLRNEHLPALFAALVDWERAKARCSELDDNIKSHHAKVRDRNAVKVDQLIDLQAARAARDAAHETVKAGRASWSALLSAWRLWFGVQADWKNVKALDKRRAAYGKLHFPSRDELERAADAAYLAAQKTAGEKAKRLDTSLVDVAALEAYGRLDMECDLAERELSIEYQSKGLSSGIRGEIDEASKPKKGLTGPGIRYTYGRPPDIRPWRLITNQFSGGISLEAAQEGTRQFRIAHEGGQMWRVWQQIGTAAEPRLITYRVKMHTPFPPGTRFQRWSLAVHGQQIALKNKYGVVREVTQYRASAIPIVSATVSKPTGDGILHCRLSWRRVPGGVLVAEFRGPHVNERLVLPDWLVEARLESKLTLSGCDSEANEFLTSIGKLPKVRQKQGVVALRQHCFTHPDDTAARSLLESMVLEVHCAQRRSRKAVRCIEKIYETVTRRVCQLHGELELQKCDLAHKKRYKTRDLLAQDAPPEPVRELRFAVAPGKLKALLLGYGLLASGEVCDWEAGSARNTDLFTGWVNSLGKRRAMVSGRK